MTTQTDNIHPHDHQSSAHINSILSRLSPLERHVKELLHMNDTLSRQLETQLFQLATQQSLVETYREYLDTLTERLEEYDTYFSQDGPCAPDSRV